MATKQINAFAVGITSGTRTITFARGTALLTYDLGTTSEGWALASPPYSRTYTYPASTGISVIGTGGAMVMAGDLSIAYSATPGGKVASWCDTNTTAPGPLGGATLAWLGGADGMILAEYLGRWWGRVIQLDAATFAAFVSWCVSPGP